MEQKQVYVIQSIHHGGNSTIERLITNMNNKEIEEQENAKTEAIAECFRRIKRDLIIAENILELYEDGIDEEGAEMMNWLVKIYQSELEQDKSSFAKAERYEKIRDEIGETAAAKSQVKFLEQLAYCNAIGHEVEIKGTEGYNKLRWLGLIEVVVQHVIGYKNGLTQMRDKFTYNLMKKNAGAKSILYKGSLHKLSDFYKPDSGFAVAAATIGEQGPQYRFANRNGVPDFFKEIVEKRYKEMKTK